MNKNILMIYFYGALFLFAGCLRHQGNGGLNKRRTGYGTKALLSIEQTSLGDMPSTAKDWAEGLLKLDKMPLAAYIIHNSNLYLFAYWGERPTGGYSVRFTKAEYYGGNLSVEIDFRSPGPEDMVTQALTYPYAAAVIEPEDPVKTVDFRALNKIEKEISLLKGIRILPPVKESSRSIKIFSPPPGETFLSAGIISGVANIRGESLNYSFPGKTGIDISGGIIPVATGHWSYFEIPAKNIPLAVEEISIIFSDGRGRRKEEITLNLKGGPARKKEY